MCLKQHGYVFFCLYLTPWAPASIFYVIWNYNVYFFLSFSPPCFAVSTLFHLCFSYIEKESHENECWETVRSSRNCPGNGVSEVNVIQVLGPRQYSSLGVSDNSSLNEEFAALCTLCFETGASFSSAGGPGTPSVAKTTELELEVFSHVSLPSCWGHVSPRVWFSSFFPICSCLGMRSGWRSHEG